MRTRGRLLTVACAGATVLALAAPAHAARTYQYTFNEHKASETFTESGLCDPGPATIHLFDYNSALHVSATEPGLSQEQVMALLEDDHGDMITKVTFTQTGNFHVTEADGTVYTGKFTAWFGGSFNDHTTVFTGTFRVNGTSADGDRVSGHFVGHATYVDGEPVVEFEKGDFRGCG